MGTIVLGGCPWCGQKRGGCIITTDDISCITRRAANLEEEGRAWKDRGGDKAKIPNRLLVTKEYTMLQQPPLPRIHLYPFSGLICDIYYGYCISAKFWPSIPPRLEMCSQN